MRSKQKEGPMVCKVVGAIREGFMQEVTLQVGLG